MRAMTPTAVIYLQFWMSFVTFLIIAFKYWIPALRERPFAAAAAPLLLLHTFRHLGMMYLTPAAVPDAPPEFAIPTAYGDLAAAVLALVALGALRLGDGPGRAAVWVFNLVGFGDLILAAVNAQRFQFLSHPLGVAYLLPIIVVPALQVTHGLLFWLLLRRR
jgi:hypothetical protein